jgi:hypothetical protein
LPRKIKPQEGVMIISYYQILHKQYIDIYEVLGRTSHKRVLEINNGAKIRR